MIEFRPVADKITWDSLIENHLEANFLQSWQWGEVHLQAGEKIERIALYRDDVTLGCFQAIIREAKRGRYMEIPGGPLIDWSDKAVLRSTTRYIKTLARKHRCVFVRIRPQAEETTPLKTLLKQASWRPAPMHLHAEHTSVINLAPDTETLLKNMRQQTRYEIRRVPKRGVKIKWLSTKQAIKEFHTLQTNTAARQRFITSSLRFLEACQQHFGESLRIYYATKNGQLLNMSVAIFYGQEADYFEAASSIEARKEPGAYGIVWRIAEDAKAMGLQRLNLWGTASSNAPNHRYAGVTTFKNGFGGDTVRFLPAHDLIVNPIAYPLNWTVETIRRKRRKL